MRICGCNKAKIFDKILDVVSSCRVSCWGVQCSLFFHGRTPLECKKTDRDLTVIDRYW